MRHNKINLCVLQPSLSLSNLDSNFSAIKELVQFAHRSYPIDLLILPENFPLWSPYKAQRQNLTLILDFFQEISSSFSIYLIGGSFHHFDHNNNCYFNTCFIYNRQGELISSYRKRKLFGRELKLGITPGECPCIFEIEGWRIGVLICADLWYPELARELWNKIDILAVPAQSVVRNQTYQTYGRRLWHALALTRAQENVCICAVSDHPALPQNPFHSGAASICDPSRALETNNIDEIQLTLSQGSPGILKMEIEHQRLLQFRQYRAQRGLIPFSN
jgi:predicted amidohydrolase